MPLKTKRWDEPAEPDDGFRVLICRYRPRALRKKDETWHQWYADLGPSKELHAAFYGKNGPPITWEEYRERYLMEIKDQEEAIDWIAEMIEEGKTITLLCSRQCVDETHCHRSLLRALIEERLTARRPEAGGETVQSSPPNFRSRLA